VITGDDLLRKIDESFPGEVSRHFRYPFIIVEVQSDDFAGKEDDERERVVAQRCGFDVQELRLSLDRLFVRTHLHTKSEPSFTRPDDGHFWLRSLAEPTPLASDQIPMPMITAIHFYGYKGGQARSTLLAFLSSVLATNDWRVLVLDADAEAPSADIIFRATVSSPEASLVGLRAGLSVAPLRVVSGSERGFVDLLAFRPSDPRFDIDSAALALEQTLAPTALTKMAGVVKNFAEGRYDLILIDHRTGLSPTVLPWVSVLPGPIVVFARLDEQWRPARPHLRALWQMAGEDPGVIVSFKQDTDPLPRYIARVRPQAEVLLDDLAAATTAASGLSEEEKPTGAEISDHWIVWPFDGSFIDGSLPALKMVGGQTLEAVSELRRLLGLGTTPSSVSAVLHRSGARDEGDLIQTGALRTLSGPNNLLFVLGRKGTGKTRLVRALADSGVGEPLLVADDFTVPRGIKANWAELKGFASDFKSEPMRLWWVLFTAAAELGMTDRSILQERIQELSELSLSALIRRSREPRPQNTSKLFLVDGLETAFSQSQILEYISALVQFISIVEGDDSLRAQGRLQIFLRTDLAIRGYENFEQLSQGRTLILEWDAQAIMNFVLSRIAALQWFQENFQSTVKQINEVYPKVRAGAVEVGDAEALLLQIFPERLKRLNLKMTTFMRTYFSDDPSGMKSFYPRIYDEFLTFIASKGSEAFATEDIEVDGLRKRVSQQLIYSAHEHATAQFLQQVRSELRYLVDLDDPQLERLLGALRGTTTPFRLERRVKEISQKARIGPREVRAAMDQMFNIGIFEIRDGFPGQWRAGRLFKSSLGMLYARGDKSPEREGEPRQERHGPP
jgi:hypothetical protein